MSQVRRSSRFDVRGKPHEQPPRPRLVYVVSDDRYFLSHCLTMARAARAAGFEVHVATRVTEDGDRLRGEEFVVHRMAFRRGRTGLVRALRTVLALRRLYRAVNPAIVHYVTVPLSLPGIVAATGFAFAAVHGVGDLARRFAAPGINFRLLRRVGRAVLRRGVNAPRAVALVQSPDDRDVLTSLGIKPARVILISGCGVDCDRFRPVPEPDGPVTVAFTGRMTAGKGLRTLVEAHRILEDSGVQSEILLAGQPDPDDPDAVPQIEVAGWGREPGITWLGHVADMSRVWRRAHVAALPARSCEGVPQSLLEAAAFGRPLIATDVPGCRDLVVHEKTGLLVPVDDAAALAAAILRLMRAPPQRVRFGVAARRLVDGRYSDSVVGPAAVALYRGLLT